MSVSFSPAQLGKHVKVWTGISCPCGVTDSEGEVIICELEGDIIKLDTEGKKHVLVAFNHYIITDKEDNIYCKKN